MTKAQHIKHAIAVVVAAIAPALIEVLGPDGAFGHKAWAAPALLVVTWAVRSLLSGSIPPPSAAVLALLAFLPATMGASCPKPPPGSPSADAGPSFVNCSDAAIHQAALNILPNVENALASSSWEAALTSIIAGIGGPLAFAEVACAVQWIETEADKSATMTEDSLEAVKAAHAKSWLAAHPVVFQ